MSADSHKDHTDKMQADVDCQIAAAGSTGAAGASIAGALAFGNGRTSAIVLEVEDIGALG
jgi:hypothetical protein